LSTLPEHALSEPDHRSHTKAGDSIRVLVGSPDSKEPLNIPVERLLAFMRFENSEILDDLVLKIDTNILNSGD